MWALVGAGWTEVVQPTEQACEVKLSRLVGVTGLEPVTSRV